MCSSDLHAGESTWLGWIGKGSAGCVEVFAGPGAERDGSPVGGCDILLLERIVCVLDQGSHTLPPLVILGLELAI